MVNVKSDENTEDSRPHCLMAKKTPPVEYNPDGPIMSCLREPQLMVVQHRDPSPFMKFRKINEDFNRTYNKKFSKKNPQCCGRYIKE